MGSIKILENTVQTYAWGSRTAITELLGKPSPAAAPWAEMWMGAHPKAPSMVHGTGGAVSLIDLITANPEATLGRTTARMFDNRLPFLFKVLAAETPLSIQAHPDKVQAEQGFERENRAGIPLDAPQRNYRDTSHKPECLCALTPFFVLCGFRPVPDILEMFFLLLPEAEVVQLTSNLVNRSAPEGLRSFIMQLLHLSAGRREAVLAWAVDRAEDLVDQDPAFQWIVRLSRIFPGDIGALAPGFLNLVNLERPGADGVLRANGKTWFGNPASVFHVTVRDPVRYFGALVSGALRRAGVDLEGGVSAALPAVDYEAPSCVLLGAVTSSLLEEVVITNKESHNHFAEQLFKLSGWKVAGKGTFATGALAASRMFEEMGIEDADPFFMVDGSGLSRENRFSGRTIASLLAAIYNSPLRDSFIRSLPVSGMDGSLENRMTEEPYRCRVRGKTGWIREVSALSGYAQSLSGEVFAFSILFNGYKGSNSVMKSIQDDICRALVNG